MRYQHNTFTQREVSRRGVVCCSDIPHIGDPVGALFDSGRVVEGVVLWWAGTHLCEALGLKGGCTVPITSPHCARDRNYTPVVHPSKHLWSSVSTACRQTAWRGDKSAVCVNASTSSGAACAKARWARTATQKNREDMIVADHIFIRHCIFLAPSRVYELVHP